jgi:hypothetical protein
MSSASTDPAETTTLAQRTWVRCLTYAGRSVVALLVLWIGWSSATTFVHLLRDATPTDLQSSESQVAPFAWEQVVADGGSWSFADGSWSVQVSEVAADAVPSALVRPLDDPEHFADPTAAERSLLSALQRMPAVPHERDGGTDLVMSGSMLQFCIRTKSIAGMQRVAWARGAVHRGDGRWTMLELETAGGHSNAGIVDPLLPTPPRAVTLATRLDRRGTPACQFLQVPGTTGELVDYWRGQAVQATPLVVGAAGLQELLCRHQDKSFHVVALNESSTSGTTVFIAALDTAPTAVATSSAPQGSASTP